MLSLRRGAPFERGRYATHVHAVRPYLVQRAVHHPTQEESTQTHGNTAKLSDTGVAVARMCMVAAGVFKLVLTVVLAVHNSRMTT